MSSRRPSQQVLGDRAPAMFEALERMGELAASYQRNKAFIEAAMQAKGMPTQWLAGWDIKFARVAALLEEIRKAEVADE